MFTEEEVDKIKKNARDTSDYKSHKPSVTESVLMVLIVVGFFTFLYTLGYALWQFWGDSSQPEPVVHVLQETVPGTTTNIIIHNHPAEACVYRNDNAGERRFVIIRGFQNVTSLDFSMLDCNGRNSVFHACNLSVNGDCVVVIPAVPVGSELFLNVNRTNGLSSYSLDLDAHFWQFDLTLTTVEELLP